MTQKRTGNRPFLRGKSLFDDVGFRKKCAGTVLCNIIQRI